MADNQTIAPKPPAIGERDFRAVLWACVAVSFCFVPFRLGVRYKVFNKLYVDDALVVLAWLLLFGHCLALDLYCDDLFGVLNTSAGLEPPSENIFQQLQGYFNVLVITTFLSPFCLWSIKASFLVFFRRLLVGVRKHERVWLVVTIYVAISFCVWMGCVQWKCTIGSVQEHLEHCAVTESSVRYLMATMKAQTAMDVTSDAAIMFIPMFLLWDAQISLRRKLVLACVFSLSVFIIVAAIIRLVPITEAGKMTDQSWLYTWTNIELAVAVIVACVCSFRALFSTKSKQSNERRDSDTEPLVLLKRTLSNMVPKTVFMSWSRRSSTDESDVEKHEPDRDSKQLPILSSQPRRSDTS